ncbi:MAG: hypothetical protein ACLTVB_08455, partial [Sutterella sp.]
CKQTEADVQNDGKDETGKQPCPLRIEKLFLDSLPKRTVEGALRNYLHLVLLLGVTVEPA